MIQLLWTGSGSGAPYLYGLPHEYVINYEILFQISGIKSTFDENDFLTALYANCTIQRTVTAFDKGRVKYRHFVFKWFARQRRQAGRAHWKNTATRYKADTLQKRRTDNKHDTLAQRSWRCTLCPQQNSTTTCFRYGSKPHFKREGWESTPSLLDAHLGNTKS